MKAMIYPLCSKDNPEDDLKLIPTCFLGSNPLLLLLPPQIVYSELSDKSEAHMCG